MPAGHVEWVGKRVELPIEVTSLGGRAPEMVLWVELPELAVVGQTMDDPEARDTSFAQSLVRAMASPLVGPPRRPARVRVEEPALADELRALSFVEVVVGPIPELEPVLRSLHAFMRGASYFSDPALGASDIEALFDAARVLWAARPWTVDQHESAIHVRIPALDIYDASVVLIGSAGRAAGFVLFPSYDELECMFEDEPHSALHFSFTAASEVPKEIVAEVEHHGWTLPHDGTYPTLLRLHEGKPALVTRDHVRAAVAVARALAALALRHPDALREYGSVELEESYADDDGVETWLTLPHPEEGFETTLRADTLGDPNPYDLPLGPRDLAHLTRALDGDGLHRLVGGSCAFASVPAPPPAAAFLAELLGSAKLASADRAERILALLTEVHDDVVARLGLLDFSWLVPVAEDAGACRAWAEGYVEVLRRSGSSALGAATRDTVAAIEAVATGSGSPASLVDDAQILFSCWRGSEVVKRKLDRFGDDEPFAVPVRRSEPKIGRNDPCPCGSGKKHKKCCGRPA